VVDGCGAPVGVGGEGVDGWWWDGLPVEGLVPVGTLHHDDLGSGWDRARLVDGESFPAQRDEGEGPEGGPGGNLDRRVEFVV
jgi:hypothetical protein